MNRLTVAEIKQKIAQERERIRAQVQPEIEAGWKEVEAREAADAAERNAMLEVGRERRAAKGRALSRGHTDPTFWESAEQREKREGRPVPSTGDTTEEVTQMAVTAPVQPYTKEKQVGKKREKATKAHNATLARAQAGAKKPTANARVKTSASLYAKYAEKKPNGNGKQGDHGVVADNASAAKRDGVRIKGSSKYKGKFFVLVAGTRDRALSGMFDSENAAKSAAKAAGLEVAKPEKK